ncbi:MAG: hypothetical protein LIO54_06295 [Oscillospiraceae bacterium]|nr:hypothetical protein [Oscillospiraceae bacterium]MCD8256539.1 hypothetical protein [Oscillospiraceae bacterium]
MHKAQVFTLVRRGLIVLLLCSAVLLTMQTDFFQSGENPAHAAAPDSGGARTENVLFTVHPRAVMVCTADGGRAASAYNGDDTEQAFSHFAAFLGEALGSSGTPEEITERGFRAAIARGGVFLDLGCPYPLDVLSAWLGTGGGGAAALDAMLVFLGTEADGGDAVCLYLCSGDEVFYRCTTAAQTETLTARMGDFLQGSAAAFAFERGLSVSGTSAYTVILETLPEIQRVSAASGYEAADAVSLLGAVGMNSYLAASYFESDGTLVCVENEKTLRVAPDGVVQYRAEAGEPVADDLLSAVNYACTVATDALGVSAGDADLMFAGIEASDDVDEEYTVYLDYCINGIPVRMAEGHAGSVTFSGGAVTRLQLVVRRYTLLTETETVLPAQYAAAIAAETGGAPVLAYMDSGDGVSCVWMYG